jgi:hypothetical protein
MGFLQVVLASVIAVGAERPFVSEEAGFEAAFPAAPAHRVMSVRTPEGPQTRHAFRVSNAQGSFYVLFACTPPPTLPSDSVKALDAIRAEGRQLFGWRTMADRRIVVSGYPGREFLDELQGISLRGRTVLGPNGSFFSIGATVPAGAPVKGAGAFVRSFRILAQAGKTVCVRK